MLFPEWTISLSEECEAEKNHISTQLLSSIRAKAFQPNPARAVEQAQQQLDDFERLICDLILLQEEGKDPRETLKKHKVRDRAFFYYYLDSGLWRLYFRRDPLFRTALGLTIVQVEQRSKFLGGIFAAWDRR